ncbi:hypothetical protein ALC57_18530, partial [Trachymyrmex cornetzi]
RRYTLEDKMFCISVYKRNIAAINSLIKDTQLMLQKGHNIVPLFDYVHLQKGIRNNFVLKDLLFISDENKINNNKPQIKYASWDAITAIYEIDKFSSRRQCGRLLKKLCGLLKEDEFETTKGKLKRPMKGRRFATIEEIKAASLEELKAIPKSAFQKCFDDWKKRWHKCIVSEGDYFEGDNIILDE